MEMLRWFFGETWWLPYLAAVFFLILGWKVGGPRGTGRWLPPKEPPHE